MIFRYLIILLLFISNYTFSQFKDPEFLNVPSIYKLNGKIDSIKTIIKDCNYLNECNDKTLWFDSKNRVIKEKYQDKYYGTITYFFLYHSNNYLIEEKSKSYAYGIKKTIYKYNNLNSLIEAKKLLNDRIIYTYKSEYQKKNRIKQTVFDKYNKVQNIFSYKYNTSGKIIEKVEEIPALKYGSAGFNKRKYFYNKKGLLIEQLEYKVKNKLVATSKYYYDKNNFLIKKEYFREVNNLYNSKTEYKYQNDYLIEMKYHNNQNDLNKIKKYKYQFDKYNNLITIMITRDKDIILDETYNITYK